MNYSQSIVTCRRCDKITRNDENSNFCVDSFNNGVDYYCDTCTKTMTYARFIVTCNRCNKIAQTCAEKSTFYADSVNDRVDYYCNTCASGKMRG